MRELRSDHPVLHTIERTCLPKSLARIFEPTLIEADDLPELPPLDLSCATDIATARLNEGWLLPETGVHPAVAGLAAELAAFLCAYGLLAEEARRGRARAGLQPIVTQAADEEGSESFWSEPPRLAILADGALSFKSVRPELCL